MLVDGDSAKEPLVVLPAKIEDGVGQALARADAKRDARALAV
jgi:hypothetical protein